MRDHVGNALDDVADLGQFRRRNEVPSSRLVDRTQLDRERRRRRSRRGSGARVRRPPAGPITTPCDPARSGSSSSSASRARFTRFFLPLGSSSSSKTSLSNTGRNDNQTPSPTLYFAVAFSFLISSANFLGFGKGATFFEKRSKYGKSIWSRYTGNRTPFTSTSAISLLMKSTTSASSPECRRTTLSPSWNFILLFLAPAGYAGSHKACISLIPMPSTQKIPSSSWQEFQSSGKGSTKLPIQVSGNNFLKNLIAQ
mgnify:CR=1 FL=1